MNPHHHPCQAFSKHELSFLKSRWAEHARRQEVPLGGLFAPENQGVKGVATALKAKAFVGVIMETLLLEHGVPLLQTRLEHVFNAMPKRDPEALKLGEFLHGLAVLARGELPARCAMHFQIADDSGKGGCNKDDLMRMLQLESHNQKRTSPGRIREVVDAIFKRALAAPEGARAVRRLTKHGSVEVTLEGFALSLVEGCPELPEIDRLLTLSTT